MVGMVRLITNGCVLREGFGFDYAHHPERLKKPLIRKEGVKKDVEHIAGKTHWQDIFREASVGGSSLFGKRRVKKA